MNGRRAWTSIAAAAVLAIGLGGSAAVWPESWRSLLGVQAESGPGEDEHEASPVESSQVKLSPQAQANLKLRSAPLELGEYWRTIQIPGVIQDRPAQSDRGVVAPVTGVVTRVHHFPGEAVKPGDTLFTIRLLSETLQLAQSELFKAMQEMEFVRDQKKRLTAPGLEGAIVQSKVIEVDNQLKRLAITVQAYRTELQSRGLSPVQIDAAGQGQFVTEVVIATPHIAQSEPAALAEGQAVKASAVTAVDPPPFLELQELKVELGQQVQAGQTLCLLSNHSSLYIEGRAFREETPLLERAVKEAWPVEVEFMEDQTSGWPPLAQSFSIRHIGNTIEQASRTFAFYLPLANQFRSYAKDGRTLTLWRFRPGQKVQLAVRVEKLENVFVLPAEAVVREGTESYVFRQNGDFFERKPVRVLWHDRRRAVLGADGSILAGMYVAQGGAAQINRAMKSGGTGLPPGYHMHADGSIHSNASHK